MPLGAFRFVLCQPVAHVLGGHGERDGIALYLVAAKFGQLRQLGIRFGTFGHYPDAQSLGKFGQGPHDLRMPRIAVDVLNEAAVDLEPVDLARIDMSERGVAGSEIVEFELDAGRAQLAQGCRDACLLVVQDDGFNDLEGQVLWRKSFFPQDLEQEFGEVRL